VQTLPERHLELEPLHKLEEVFRLVVLLLERVRSFRNGPPPTPQDLPSRYDFVNFLTNYVAQTSSMSNLVEARQFMLSRLFGVPSNVFGSGGYPVSRYENAQDEVVAQAREQHEAIGNYIDHYNNPRVLRHFAG